MPDVDDRHGVVKSLSEEEHQQMSHEKRDAYVDLATQLDDLLGKYDPEDDDVVEELG